MRPASRTAPPDAAPHAPVPLAAADGALAQAVAILALAFAWLAYTVPAGGYETDLDSWIRWSHRIARFGLTNVYGGVSDDTNYLPVFLWVLAGLNRIAGGPLTSENVHLVKVATLAFGFASAVALASLLARRGRSPALALLVALNPATLYVGWVWGQIDAIHTALLVMSWIALARGWAAAAAVLVVLAVNAKMQSVAFAPFFLLALAHVLGARWRRWLATLAACAAVQLALFLPFLHARALRALWRNVFGVVGYFDAVSLNAYNVWYFLVGDPAETHDTEAFLGFTYRHWGVAALAIALAVLAVPFARWVRRLWRDGALDRLDQHGFLFLGLAGIAFFAFPTEVHERFLYPAVVLLGVDAVLRGRYLAYGLLSTAFFLNLEDVLRWRGWGYGTVLFAPRTIAAAILAVFAASTWQAYRRTAPLRDAPLARPEIEAG